MCFALQLYKHCRAKEDLIIHQQIRKSDAYILTSTIVITYLFRLLVNHYNNTLCAMGSLLAEPITRVSKQTNTHQPTLVCVRSPINMIWYNALTLIWLNSLLHQRMNRRTKSPLYSVASLLGGRGMGGRGSNYMQTLRRDSWDVLSCRILV